MTNLFIALLVIEVATLMIIGYFSGYTGLGILDPFNLEWLAVMNIFIGLPWILGLGVGSLRLIAKSH